MSTGCCIPPLRRVSSVSTKHTEHSKRVNLNRGLHSIFFQMTRRAPVYRGSDIRIDLHLDHRKGGRSHSLNTLGTMVKGTGNAFYDRDTAVPFF